MIDQFVTPRNPYYDGLYLFMNKNKLFIKPIKYHIIQVAKN